MNEWPSLPDPNLSTSMPESPASILDRGSAMARLLLRIAGWKVCYHGTPPGCGVIIAYPHTSNWDFVVGVLAKWSIGIPLTFLSKDSLFRLPLFGRFLRWTGGIPVDRASASGVIAEMTLRLAQAEQRSERWWLAMAPEGTRKKDVAWRSGFYHIAVAAQVPIGLAYFDYSKREIGVTMFLRPTGDAERDLQQIAEWYGRHAVGRWPEQATPVRFKGSPRD